MKLYDFPGAPNPRRVRMFAAEKGIALTSINTDMSKGEHKTPEFLRKNPSGKIPVLELDDGTCIGESVAICRYLEHIEPEPNLFGEPGAEAGVIEMHHRHIELELLGQVGIAWVNGPVVGKIFPDLKQIPEARERAAKLVHAFYARLDATLSEQPYVAAERFTIADITAFITIDFASTLVGLPPSGELAALAEWQSRISSRSSAAA